VSHGERRRQVAVVGSTSEFLEVRRLTLARGRFLPHGEVVRGPAVAVLGATVARAALASSAAAG
jgi:putative ABC transport system permease protein